MTDAEDGTDETGTASIKMNSSEDGTNETESILR